MPRKFKRTLKKYKPSFRKRFKKTPLYKKLGHLWRVKTQYQIFEGTVPLYIKNYQMGLGIAQLGRTQIMYAISFQGIFQDIFPYLTADPTQLALTQQEIEPFLGSALGTANVAQSLELYPVGQEPPVVNVGWSPKVQQFVMSARSCWCMSMDIIWERPFAGNVERIVGFRENTNDSIPLECSLSWALDPSLIRVNPNTYGKAENVLTPSAIDHRSGFGRTYNCKQFGHHGMKIKARNPAAPTIGPLLNRGTPLTAPITQPNPAGLPANWAESGYLYLIFDIGVQVENQDDAMANIQNLQLGQLKIRKHFAMVKNPQSGYISALGGGVISENFANPLLVRGEKRLNLQQSIDKQKMTIKMKEDEKLNNEFLITTI